MKRFCILFLFFSLLVPVFPALAAERGDPQFEAFLQGVRTEAAQRGISAPTIRDALSETAFLPRVIELDGKQPEKTKTFDEYTESAVSQSRVMDGQDKWREHQQELQRISMEYGVPAHIIMALWGIETSFGKNTGGFHVVPALATLAYDGRRSAFFRAELFKALQIIDAGHVSADDMLGSWAGAMGQNQFMPSSFLRFAVDENGDGRRDIWNTLPDVFASTANYLREAGWRSDLIWGMPVTLPQNFPGALLGLDAQKSISQWQDMGVQLSGRFPQSAQGEFYTSIIRPDGPQGRAFMVTDNYRVLMRWNKSLYFATSVGMLADAMATDEY